MRRWALLTTGILVLSLGAWVVGVSAGNSVLEAGLNGDKEVSSTGEKGVGDPNGRGKAVVRINVERRRACFSLSWNRIATPSMAHIHEGDADTAGPIVIPLFMTGDDEAAPGDQDLPDTLDSAGGCVTDVERALLRRIKNNPRDFYVNIHNDPFPAGAIRGQLHR
jgi:hypothetical protein